MQGQGQFASAMGGAATQTGKLGTAAQTTGKHVDETGKKAKSAGGRMQTFAGGVAKFAAATGALFAAQQVVKDAIGNAVDLGEQMNKTAVVFRGPGAKAIQDWSKSTATALGISQRQALESAGVLGNMLVPMGIGRQKAADMSKSFVNLAADMASFNNASPEETLDALRSGLAGETEPLRKFGVFLNEARIKQQAMKMGLYDGTGELEGAGEGDGDGGDHHEGHQGRARRFRENVRLAREQTTHPESPVRERDGGDRLEADPGDIAAREQP